MPAILAGVVVTLDLLWRLLVGSTGSLAYGLVDEPAHLATCAIVLLAIGVAVGRLSTRFVVAALCASVAIDLDHLPGYLGWHALTGSLPRPYSHSLVLVGALVVLGCVTRRDRREVALGLALGASAHLLRDLATGPGIPLAWPLSGDVFTMPYAYFVLALAVGLAAVAVPHGTRLAARVGIATGLAALTLGATVVAPARAAPARDAIGVYLPGSDWNPELLDRYAGEAGREPAIVSIYRDWSEAPFQRPVLDPIAARGAVPMVTWEPWRDWSKGVSLATIAAGGDDAYIAEAARQAAAWGGPLFVRFAHEMNGDWYPWGVEARRNPALYKAAWRHIVTIFREQGASKVRWVWTPYVEGDSKRPFRRYYPGDKWVNWAGLDGFNWGPKSVSFAELFQGSYATLVQMTKKPLIVAEIGSVGYGDNKPEWIRRTLGRALPRYTHIRALVWWNAVHPNGADVRIDTSSESLAAWREALQAPRFAEGWEFLLARPAWLQRR